MDELLNPEIDERLVPYIHMIPVWYAGGSIGVSAFDIAWQKLDGEKKVQEYWTGLAKMLAGRTKFYARPKNDIYIC